MPHPATPSSRSLNPALSTAFATLVAALALLPMLGAKPLTDWDEAIYAEVAREMLRFGMLIPHWNYALWLEKPPLSMWITSILYRVLGVNEFAARACSALSGVATVALLHGFLARTRSTLAAWLSTAILLGTLGFLHSCHTGEVDTLLAFTCTVSILGLARTSCSPRSGWLLFWIGFGLSAMTKSAASIVLPLTAAALTLAPPRIRPPWQNLRISRHTWPGLVIFLLIVLPWHLLMLHRFGNLFLHEYLGFHVLTRSTHQIEGHATHWWFYLKVLLVAAPPFALLYPVAVARALKPHTSKPHDTSLQPWALFTLITLALYTLVQTRLPQYIVPAYPALALLTAVYIADRLRPVLALAHPASFWIKRTALTVVASAALVAITTPARKTLHSASVSANGTAIPLLDSKDSIALLRNLQRTSPVSAATVPGALLLWRTGPLSSIATDVFYARRAILQVQLQPQSIPPDQPRDRYRFDPVPFERAAAPDLRLILLDRTLVPLIPPNLTYSPITSQGTVELGTIILAPSSRK